MIYYPRSGTRTYLQRNTAKGTFPNSMGKYCRSCAATEIPLSFSMDATFFIHHYALLRGIVRRILHTADLHIGKVLNEFSLLEDQRHILQQIVSILQDYQVDVLVIAGDLYDRAIPSSEGVRLLDDFLVRVTGDLKIPVLAISGNHDSGQRVAFASRLLDRAGLYLAGIPKLSPQKVTLSDQYGEVDFYLLPFLEPATVRPLLSPELAADIHSYDQAFGAVLDPLVQSLDPSRRSSFVAHGMFAAAKAAVPEERLRLLLLRKQRQQLLGNIQLTDGLEEVAVGGVDLVNSRRLFSFDYAALGHLHSSLAAGVEWVRFSGSPLAYSVSEGEQGEPIEKAARHGKSPSPWWSWEKRGNAPSLPSSSLPCADWLSAQAYSRIFS